jgi:hypothetical protein
MLKYSQIYWQIEAEAKHKKEFDGLANNRGVIANRPYMDTWLTRHPYIGSVTETMYPCRGLVSGGEMVIDSSKTRDS